MPTNQLAAEFVQRLSKSERNALRVLLASERNELALRLALLPTIYYHINSRPTRKTPVSNTFVSK